MTGDGVSLDVQVHCLRRVLDGMPAVQAIDTAPVKRELPRLVSSSSPSVSPKARGLISRLKTMKNARFALPLFVTAIGGFVAVSRRFEPDARRLAAVGGVRTGRDRHREGSAEDLPAAGPRSRGKRPGEARAIHRSQRRAGASTRWACAAAQSTGWGLMPRTARSCGTRERYDGSATIRGRSAPTAHGVRRNPAYSLAPVAI